MKRSLLLFVLIGFLFQSCLGQNKQLTVGDSIPKFSLKDQDDSLINIKDYIGKKILVIFFYPKDESMVCTKEACTFRDSIPDFTKAGAIVLGINNGSVASHKEFKQHHNLAYNLLSDSGDTVKHMFGISNGLSNSRVTFVIDKSGVIVFTFNSLLQGKEHVDKALEFIREMSNYKKTDN